MEYQRYLEKQRSIQKSIIEYIDGFYNIEEDFQNLINSFNNQKVKEDPNEIKSILRLLLIISNNHMRSSTFFSRIEKIILYLQKEIQSFFNSDILFDIFKSNKRILLFLIQEKIIKLNTRIIDIMTSFDYQRLGFRDYFYHEIMAFIDAKLETENIDDDEIELKYNTKKSDEFEKNRNEGENHQYLAYLIRNDLIEEFITFINKQCLVLTTKIESSIFETNCFLINKNTSMIKYAAFFGSIQIFKYLYKNNAKLKSSLCKYAIHGSHPEIIQILNDHGVLASNAIFEECLYKSIKCHHIDTANYILSNFIHDNKITEMKIFILICIHSYNYLFLPDTLDEIKNYFLDLSEFDYFEIVKLLFQNQKIDINKAKICIKIIQ